MTPLSECLKDWMDPDGAEFHLARSLGILAPEVPFATEAKHVFWSSNELGDALHDILEVLVRIGALEFDEGEQKYRWNASFVWKDISSRRGR